MSEIQALTERVTSLNQSVDFWNTAMTGSLIAAAMVAAAIGVTTWMAVARTSELSRMQQELIRAKDAELAIELRKKDEQISKANKEAALANERAEAARAEAAKANERIQKMQQLRRLDKDKAAVLAPLLRSDLFQKDPKPCLRISAVDDSEAQMYAMDFLRLFESCRVNIYPTDGGLPTRLVQHEPSADGLQLMVKSTQNPNQAFAQFQRLVHSLGIAIPVGEDPSYRHDEATLEILRKPA